MAQSLCKQCGKTVVGSDVRYISANEYLCTACYDGRHGKMRGPIQKTSKERFNADPTPKKTLVCAKCDFVNRFRKDQENPVCGYCGSKELREENSSAASLLAEADVDTQE